MDYKPNSEDSSDSEDESTLKLQNQQQNQSIHITDPQQYLNFSVKDKKIKVMDECNPIFTNVYLKDISLHKKGPLEDKIYSKINKYYINIRRGNTLCQIYHPQQINNKYQTYDIFFCRRGMKKFYDLEPEYLKVRANLSTHHRLMRKRIFQLLEKDLQNVGSVYHLYCLFKENGQHCQISFVKPLDSWLFASKNVAILANSPQDLQKYYHKQRFYWAKLIGIQFFRILYKMSNEQQQSFKEDIKNYTLLGEHCGNQQHQHITKYEKVEIIFYGLVSNTGFDHCQPVQQCRQFLLKYGLKMSYCKQRKNLDDKNKIFSSMWQMLKQVAEGTMAKQGEGSVMYIVAEKEGKQRTMGMCKLKTCQYLIYRKLREMLKLNVARKGMTANSFEKFKFEVQQLVKHYFRPPKSLEFYFQLGQQAFKQCERNSQISQTYLRYKYVDFISKFEQNYKAKPLQLTQAAKRVLLVCLPRLSNSIQKYCKANQFQLQYMYRAGKPITKNTLYILYLIPRLAQPLQNNYLLIIPKYTQEQIIQCIAELNDCKDLTRSQLITFIKSQDKSKSVYMLNQKMQHFRKNCRQNGVNFLQIESTEEKMLEQIHYVFIDTEKPTGGNFEKDQVFKKHFILPLLIPGSGKSTLSKEIMGRNKSNFVWKKIDSDQIRRECMQLKDKVDLDDEAMNRQLFIETKQHALQNYRKKLVSQAENKPLKHQCVFVDRIFSPYNIEETIQTLFKMQKDYIRIHILTQSNQQTKMNDKNYPYSLNYLLTCLKRCLERAGHQTMPNDPYAVTKIVVKFYQMMSNFNSKSITRINPEKINFISLPLISQSEQTKCINQVLKKKVEECLSQVEPGREAKDNSCFIQLVEALYKFGEFKDSKDFQRYSQLARSLQRAIQRSQ